MHKLSNINELYKPFRYTIRGNSTIIETTSGNFVIKKKPKNTDLIQIFNYLSSRSFTNFPKVLNETRDETYIYEYVEDKNLIDPQKGEDLIELVGLLHAKTSFNKEVTEEKYKEIYENILNNILYLQDYYLKYYELYLHNIYMSPSEYSFVRNYAKINAALNFSHQELDNWYTLVSSKHSERISLIHNNLSKEHFIRSDDDYLISWDHATFDTPILDLVTLYKKDFWLLDFETLYQKYLNVANISEEEEKLFFVLISLVPEIKFEGSEFTKCKNMRKDLDYIYKTEMFLKPHFNLNKEEV